MWFQRDIGRDANKPSAHCVELPHGPSQPAAYIASWLEAHKKDRNEIFRAATTASKAIGFVLKREREQEHPDSHAERVAAKALQQARYADQSRLI